MNHNTEQLETQMSDEVERASAIREISIHHESVCGKPGVFAKVRDTGGAWAAVIEHYDPEHDPERPLEPIGKPCRYTARHVWQVEHSG
jgi:hypothetical protein